MGKVHQLPEDIVRGIAAGEVVERPAAVLKELIENSLDAGATRLDIEIRDAGRTRLRVTDDGCGLSPEDARLALERHATSKITTLADLDRVRTYGFRGEALPSIAAVSRFELLTRPAETTGGWRIAVDGGRVVSEGPAGAPVGSTVTVADLFFNTPARLKFLKSDATERGQLLRVAEDAALAAPGVSWRVSAEGKDVWSLSTSAPGADRDRLAALWGGARADTLKTVRAEQKYASVHGWVSDVHSPQATARYQRLFINHRPVTNRRLLHALYDGYRGRLLVGRHPAAVLFLEIDPTLVDVNVHPTKREVRLSHEEELHGLVSRAVREALEHSATPRAVFAFSAAPAGAPVDTPPPRAVAPSPTFRAAEFGGVYRSLDGLPAAERASGEPLPLDEFKAARFEPLSQLYATYILARVDDRCFVFDQHAAAERVLYEALRRRNEAGAPARQPLLIPWVWEPSPEAAALLTERRGEWDALGFDLEPFGGGALRVRAVPAALPEHLVRPVLEGLVEDMLQGRLARGVDAVLVRAACRGSVKAGDPLAPPEMDRLIVQLQSVEHPWTCPHGRPTFLQLASEDLAKRFHRL
ncbi:MAG: DNA mismatch repair endonuclease MutL [Elusimicrobia bacterium]|nr:DNA mismatch repair endonuclease MutL [Elusimicrobiota bacterium]MBK7574722.1 DNA mismatch repair endonuclease MutL [Elusimicrobiota bacterium]MBK7688705.1 DNA mismatch repair endonuclease MutL [Elusimicrobiota bacterium]MBK8126866.1 DNA mismatch repair endonuclease MutL [Elusimicrobiota bacterium]MBK8423683.1 DNA mismatch repair endonuclease MutL [Elusimicrobiota bacterium]